MSYAEFGGRILNDLPATDFTIRDRVIVGTVQVRSGEGGDLSPAEKGSLQIRFKRNLAALLQAGGDSRIDLGQGVSLSRSAVFEMVEDQGDQLKKAGLGERAVKIRELVKSRVG